MLICTMYYTCSLLPIAICVSIDLRNLLHIKASIYVNQLIVIGKFIKNSGLVGTCVIAATSV